jgi:protein transport protein SEC31
MQPGYDVTGVAWNKQVPHILGTTGPGGRTLIWDLRASKPIISIASGVAAFRPKSMQWHPDEVGSGQPLPFPVRLDLHDLSRLFSPLLHASQARELVMASEDDSAPFIQLWDLRNAHAPVRQLAGHTKVCMPDGNCCWSTHMPSDGP